MTAVFTQVQGDGVRARSFRQQGRFNRTWITRFSRLAQRGDMVDVDAEKDAHFISNLKNRGFAADCTRSKENVIAGVGRGLAVP